MRIILPALLTFILFTSSLNAQIAVESFRVLPTDQTARITDPVVDQNGEKCALIKVVSTMQGLLFEGGMLGIMKREWKNGEYWVYVPHGTKRITIKHDQLGVLRNYIYPEAISEATVYEMALTTGTVVTTIVAPEIEGVWLMVTSDPTGADLYIDDTYVGQTPFQKKLKKQRCNYRLSKAKYQPNAGVVDLSNTEDKKQLDLTLKPDFGSVYIATEPESGAEVIFDNRSTGKTTPCTLNEVESGTHRITLRKEWYEPVVKEFTLAAEEEKNLTVNLVPSFGEITITTDPKADIFIDNQKKNYGQHTCRLSPGIYSIKAQKAKHNDEEQSIEIVVGDKKTISLNPRPQYGALDVASTPWEADITIDGKNYGKTPKTIKNLLIGTYTVKLTKAGYAPLTKTLTIDEGETESINVELPSGKQVTINSNPQGAKLYIDNEYKGATPFTTELSFGRHNVKLTQTEYIDLNQRIEVTETTTNINLTLQTMMKDIPGMIFVKGGCFQMGSKEYTDEKPVHQVCVNDFYIGKYEVTQKQWKEIMGNNPSNFKCNNCPVERVSWNDVQDFIKKLNTKTGQTYRLPTEAEWEYAARGGDQSRNYKYSGSNNIDDVAWYGYEKSGKKTHAVGTKQANELSIYDMSGNVWEWCSDWYKDKYYRNSPERNPQGPSNGSLRVLRGGSWFNIARYCRVAYRLRHFPDRSSNYLGFRLTRSSE
ncbi:MAG: PEGA domain-containing protein [Bacteroidetes bacterium]|nr:PEGA domain-containing protein [Bacteroidota bacterium]